jgi:hypothetical protein
LSKPHRYCIVLPVGTGHGGNRTREVIIFATGSSRHESRRTLARTAPNLSRVYGCRDLLTRLIIHILCYHNNCQLSIGIIHWCQRTPRGLRPKDLGGLADTLSVFQHWGLGACGFQLGGIHTRFSKGPLQSENWKKDGWRIRASAALRVFRLAVSQSFTLRQPADDTGTTRVGTPALQNLHGTRSRRVYCFSHSTRFWKILRPSWEYWAGSEARSG